MGLVQKYALLIAAVGGLLGPPLLFSAVRWRRQAAVLSAVPTEPIAELSDGMCAVEGRAVVDEDRGPASAPLTDDPCLIGELVVEGYYKRDNTGSWRVKDRVAVSTPFAVDDGTGELLVDPEGAAHRLDLEETGVEVYPQYADSPPEMVQSYENRKRNLLSAASEHRYKQRLLRPGEEVFVLGPVARTADPGGSIDRRDLVMADHDSVPGDVRETFLVTNRDREELSSRVPWATIAAVLGVGLPVGSAALLYWRLSPAYVWIVVAWVAVVMVFVVLDQVKRRIGWKSAAERAW